jgi:hypothetical protein
MSKPGFSIADLQQGAKKLNTVDSPADSKAGQSGGSTDSDREATVALGKLLFRIPAARPKTSCTFYTLWSLLVTNLVRLYESYDGDLDKM